VAADVEAQELLLHGQQHAGGKLLDVGQVFALTLRRLKLWQIKEGDLAVLLMSLKPLARLKGPVHYRQELRALGANGIEGPCLDQALHNSPVELAGVDSPAKLRQGLEAPSPLALSYNGVYDPLPHILDGGEATADLVPDNGEVSVTLVDIRG